MISIPTLIFILCLLLMTQVIVLFFQYRINKSYRGIGIWLLGTSFIALGFMLMPMIKAEPLGMLARIANPLVILGHIFLYVGIKRFLNQALNKWLAISIFLVFNLFYYYFMFISNDVSARTFIITTTTAIISFMIAYQLFFKKDKRTFNSSNFTGTIFLVYGCFYVIRTLRVIISPSMNSYLDQTDFLIIGFIISIIISNLWTFGLILMINERLNSDNQLEKEKLQSIFNTSPDAQFITRLNDGFVIDVNNGFSELSGYSKPEVIGSYLPKLRFWHKPADRRLFITELDDKGTCENKEFVFQRKDKSQFDGMISARIIMINSVLYITSVIQDISERKKKELQIQKLVQQLEIEKNTAYLNSITDSLTGLANRGFFDETLKNEFLRLKRSGEALSLIMIDIDYFKKFNDTYGHVVGDECLQMVAARLKTIIGRAPDLVARYGGEEFIVILPETGEEGARILGERIRKAIEDLAILHSASDISNYVTASVGIVSVYPSELISAEEILRLVDEALYCAKKEGRNRCFYSADTKLSNSLC